MAEDNIDDILKTTRRPRQSLVARPSVTETDFANVIQRPSLVSAIQGSLRDINGALDEITGTPSRSSGSSGSSGRDRGSGWRPSMKKQISNKLGINMMDEMGGIGEDEAYDYSERNEDDDSDLSECLDQQSLGLLQRELDDARSEYSQGASKEDEPSVIGGDLENLSLEDDTPENHPTSERNDPPDENGDLNSNFIDVGDKPVESETKQIRGEETTATSDSGSGAGTDSVPPEIRFNSPMPPDKSVQTLNETEIENTDKSDANKELDVSDHEYEIGMQHVKYRALEERMALSQMQSERMLEEQSQELKAEKESKSMLELQLLKLQADYDKLYQEKEMLHKINKIQQKAIVDLQSKYTNRWR